ncbi:Conserved_hypothetical protein [Hexamita inflata]|nr:Conserved hypothetical protein [Hexamita inflata]
MQSFTLRRSQLSQRNLCQNQGEQTYIVFGGICGIYGISTTLQLKMGRKSMIDTTFFGTILQQKMTEICGYSVASEEQLFREFNDLSNSKRQACWQALATQIGRTPNQVKDFYYNSWTKQFSADPAKYQDELMFLIRKLQLFCSEDNLVRSVCHQFTESHSLENFNAKTLNKFVRKLMGCPESSSSQSFSEHSSSVRLIVFENLE